MIPARPPDAIRDTASLKLSREEMRKAIDHVITRHHAT